MQFTTPVKLLKANFNVTHKHQLMVLGSCFAKNIGNKLSKSKFKLTINPNGVIYNPISIAKNLSRYINNKPYTAEDFMHENKAYYSLFHSNKLHSTANLHHIIKQFNASLFSTHKKVKKLDTLIITFGTAWVFEYNNKVVANCHKLPSQLFSQRLLSVEEIVTVYKPIIASLKQVNIIFTVSPVRHIKTGLHENNLSKSVLHLAINKLLELNSNCYYFPAYELVNDELRDYRFFNRDLVHPNEIAVDFVWEKFKEVYFSKETIALIEKINKVEKFTQHKPFNIADKKHQNFIKDSLQKIEQLKTKHPYINFNEEKSLLSNQLNK